MLRECDITKTDRTWPIKTRQIWSNIVQIVGIICGAIQNGNPVFTIDDLWGKMCWCTIFIWCFQQIVVPLRGKEQNTMGNHSTNSAGSASMQYTEKGNVLYRFEHLTQEQLNTYRVDVYGYLMWFFVLSVSILDEKYGWCCTVFAVSFPFNKNTAVVYCPRRGISEPFLWH